MNMGRVCAFTVAPHFPINHQQMHSRSALSRLVYPSQDGFLIVPVIIANSFLKSSKFPGHGLASFVLARIVATCCRFHRLEALHSLERLFKNCRRGRFPWITTAAGEFSPKCNASIGVTVFAC